MNLEDIFQELTYGELSQLAVGGRDQDEPEIAEQDRPQIIRHISTALTAIYKRFRLREKQVWVQLTEGKSGYVLDSKFRIANTQSSEPLKYLVDTEFDTFDDSLLKVEDVKAFRTEMDLPISHQTPYVSLKLNETDHPYSVRTPSLKTLLMPDQFGPHVKTLSQVLVTYRANHPPLDRELGFYAPMEVPIELPVTHLQALLFHVASRILNPTGMVDEFNAGNTWYAKYEGEVKRLAEENIQIDHMQDNTNFERQGFV